MAEKDIIFSSKLKHVGIFKFQDFYKFCYDWLVDETQLDVTEEKYVEAIKGDAKEVTIEWVGVRKVTDYFKFEIKVKWLILGMREVEVTDQRGNKIKTNQASVEMKITGTLIRDYRGKFEDTGFKKFLRGIYEKWVIASRIEQYEEKLFGDADEFSNEVKAWLALEGKK